MGCCTSRYTITPEERWICYYERQLNFKSISPKTIEFVFKKWVGPEGLTLKRFQKSSENLGINIGDLSSPDDNIYQFYKQFKTNDTFNIDELIIFGVFECSARPEDKAEVWYDIIDKDLSGRLLTQQVKDFIKCLYKLTYKYLPKIASGTDDKFVSPEQIQVYIEKADLHSEKFSAHITDLLTSNIALDKPGFQEKLREHYKITYPEGFRVLVKEFLNNGNK
ncbi:unnamed protein product [Blepharisma stoltei]|uniref:EF-hand domain-containing protein n=1 Tax=Blepharisma stoltei TaxID=1481888 RepID=A0AAU9IWK9_9CILI|nr:unnamed protein product [Blepharisma stoltei]